jgi:predicted ribosome quality control (RQC) complex YloA/Tae2 family protein
MEKIIYTFNNIEYNIVIGKNRFQNWEIIDSSKETDIWFHAENHASAHVILETNIPLSQIPRQVLKRCACLCKCNSKSKTLQKCPIIYTTINNVVKTNIVGQVLSQNTRRIII